MKLTGKIYQAIQKFDLNLKGVRVLTEAATGNYVVTPIIAAAGGALVTAFTRNSAYGTVADVRRQTLDLAVEMGLTDRIQVVTSIAPHELYKFDLVTNCGFLRPLNRDFIIQLSPNCVIPLMYEPWEFRDAEIDLEACKELGIKVYGTNEADPRLQTMEYIGLTALYLLLDSRRTFFSTTVLVIGCGRFVKPIFEMLTRVGYQVRTITSYETAIDVTEFGSIVIAEHKNTRIIIGPEATAFIRSCNVHQDTHVVHIAGNVNFEGASFSFTPQNPRPFGYMSYTADFIDSQAVVDLHAAGLKVGEGMIAANRQSLSLQACRSFMEDNYPALAI